MDAQPGSDLTGEARPPGPDVGLDHLPPLLRAVLDGNPPDPASTEGMGFGSVVQFLFDLLERSPEHRTIMGAARRAGRPWSWAEEHWADLVDVAMEIAYDAHLAAVQERACPNCGTDPDQVVDPETGRLLDSGHVKIENRGCEVCATTARNSDIDTDERKMLGTYLKNTHRAPGEPFFDDGGYEFERGSGMSDKLHDLGGFAG